MRETHDDAAAATSVDATPSVRASVEVLHLDSSHCAFGSLVML